MRMTFVFLLSAALSPAVASAQVHAVDTTLRDFIHARSFGTGGAFRGLGLGADSVDGNPAAMSTYPRYQTELSGAWEIDGRLLFGDLALVDSQSNRIAAGVSYHFAVIGQGSRARTVNYETFAGAVPVADWLHFGISVHHLLMSGTDPSKSGGLGPSAANAITGDAGLMLRLFQAFNLGFSAHNLIDTGHPELARYFVASAAFVGQLFTADVDVRADFGAVPNSVSVATYTGPPNPAPLIGWSVGAEYILGVVPIRAGYSVDPVLEANYLSFGLGIMTETGNIDIGYRQQLNGSAKLLAISVRLGN